MPHDGGFTCAQADEGAQAMAAFISSLRDRITTIADEACGIGPIMPIDDQLTRIERKLFELRLAAGEATRELTRLQSACAEAGV